VPPPESQAQEPDGIDLGAAPAPPPAPAAPGASASTRPTVRKRKKSIVPMIVVIGGGVVCLVALILFIYFPMMRVHTAKGWMLKSDYAAMLAEQNKAAEPTPTTIPAMASADNVAPVEPPTRPRRTTTTTAPEGPWTPPAGETAADINEENAKGMDEGAVMADKDKEKVMVRKNKVYPDDQDPRMGDVAIEVENLSPTKTIRTLVLSLEIMNGEHVVGQTDEAKLEYIPPSEALHYSVKYRLNSKGKNFRAVVTKLEYAEPNVVCWMAKDNLQFDEAPNELLKITGHARNTTANTVRDIVLYYTLLNPRGELVNPKDPLGQVKLQDKTSLIKDASDRFIIKLDKRNNTEEVKDADIRVVGKKG
jgi:hypothetical protein